jgi:hypothetical protein
MQMMPTAEHSNPPEEPERPASFFGGVFHWTAEYTKAKKYFRTRRAVLDGENLFDLTSGELKARDLMGPLSFNWFETTLAALPTQIVVALAWFVSGSEVSATLASVEPEAFSTVYTKVSELLAPLIIPGTLFLAAGIAGRTSLRREHRSKEAVRRARDAFLYFDGAHFLWPSAAASFVLTGATAIHWNVDFRLVGALGYFAARRVEDELFATNGYETGPYRTSLTGESAPLGRPPRRWLYRVGVGLGTLVIVGVLNVVVILIAQVVAVIAAAIRARLIT